MDLVRHGRSDRLLRRLQRFDLGDLLAAPFGHAYTELDQRVLHAVAALASAEDRPPLRAQVAAQVALSESRFNHLFSDQMGVCFRRYRLWLQLRRLLRLLPQHRSLTDAAMHAGFADSAHFSRAFNDMIGLPPSAVLRALRSLELVS